MTHWWTVVDARGYLVAFGVTARHEVAAQYAEACSSDEWFDRAEEAYRYPFRVVECAQSGDPLVVAGAQRPVTPIRPSRDRRGSDWGPDAVDAIDERPPKFA